jgi:hypothetical protein
MVERGALWLKLLWWPGGMKQASTSALQLAGMLPAMEYPRRKAPLTLHRQTESNRQLRSAVELVDTSSDAQEQASMWSQPATALSDCLVGGAASAQG